MVSQAAQLEDFIWLLSRMGELLENLARRSKLITNPVRLPGPPDSLAKSDIDAVDRWVGAAAGRA